MKRVIVYVEGPSDRDAMYALLGPLLERKQQEGVGVRFVGEYKERGDRKKVVLTKVPVKAVEALRDPYAVVVVIPDLYPRNKAFPHETFEEMARGIHERFDAALNKKGGGNDVRISGRFRVFCFKHDLEALVLASVKALGERLRAHDLKVTWKVPVEDQDHDHPPKRVVEGLFRERGTKYKDTLDAPAIMRRSNYEDVVRECPQCFKPFVEFLESL